MSGGTQQIKKRGVYIAKCPLKLPSSQFISLLGPGDFDGLKTLSVGIQIAISDGS